MIPISDTPHKNLQKQDNELWHIIEEQRNVIQELQKALNDMTLERDALQARLNCTTNNVISSNTTTSSSSSISSYAEENSNNTQQQQQLTNSTSKNPLKTSNNNKLPVPPPRSPYRSNTQIDTHQKKSSSTKKRTDTRHSSLPNLQQDDDRDQVFDREADNVVYFQVNVKAILASSIVLSIINKKSGKELWKVGKSYTDLLTLDIALNDQHKLKSLLDNSEVEKRLYLFQEYFSNIILKDDIAFTSFCSFICKNEIQKEGYLMKRGKYNAGGSRRYYFIMNGSTLKYFHKHGDQLYLGMIPFTPETRIGKQTTTPSIPTAKKTPGDDDLLFQHAFIVLLESASINKYILCAESDSERDEWVRVLHTQQYTIAKKASLSTIATRKRSTTISAPIKKSTSNSNITNKDIKLNIPKARAHRSNSDTSVRPTEKDTPIVIPTKIRQKTYQRSSLDDQAILRYLEANSVIKRQQPQQQQEQQRHIILKESAESLPSQLDENMKRKKSENRKTFWSRQKFFSSSTVEPGYAQNKSDAVPYSSNVESYSTSSVSTTNTATFQVFGVPLKEAIKLSKVSDNFELPAIVFRCIEYLEQKNAVHEEGIYRLSGSSVQIASLRHQFCEYGDVDILALNDHQIDVHVVAGLLKMWLRELPVNVLTNELLNEFISVIDMTDKKMRIERLGQLVSMLPIENYSLLRTLVAHLIHIVHHSEQNKMTLRNVGIVFAPTLFIPSGVLTLLMSEFEYIFWIDDVNKITPKTKQRQYVTTKQPPPPVAVHPTIRPKPSTSADKFKEQYLRAEEMRSNRNSLMYKNNVPMSIISLENVINKDHQHRRNLLLAQEDIERNGTNDGDEGIEIELYYRL